MNDILGENIARLRKEKGMTQEDLARELNISYQAVSKWENGISSPDISNIKLLAQFFGVSIDALFGLELLPQEKEKTPVTDEEPDALDREPDALNRELDAPEDARKEPEDENRPAAGPERRDSAETAMLPWDDDNTLRAVLFKGRRLLSAEEVQRGIFAGKVSLEYNGDALNVFSFFDVSCGAVSGNVESGGDVRADAVGGFVSAQGDVNCGNVGAAVNCGGDVDCGDVGGDVRAGDDVDCGTVIGSVSAGGDVNCGVVRGNVSASGDVKCGIVGGRES